MPSKQMSKCEFGTILSLNFFHTHLNHPFVWIIVSNRFGTQWTHINQIEQSPLNCSSIGIRLLRMSPIRTNFILPCQLGLWSSLWWTIAFWWIQWQWPECKRVLGDITCSIYTSIRKRKPCREWRQEHQSRWPAL